MSGWRGQLKVGISLVSKLHALLGKGKGMGGAHLLAVDTGSSALCLVAAHLAVEAGIHNLLSPSLCSTHHEDTLFPDPSGFT